MDIIPHQEIGTAVRDEGERKAGNRHDSENHTHINEYVKEKNRRDPCGEKRTELVFRLQRYLGSAHYNNTQEAEDDHRSQKAPFFGDHREDEIRRFLREESQLRLRPVEKTLPEKPPEPIAILDWMTL